MILISRIAASHFFKLVVLVQRNFEGIVSRSWVGIGRNLLCERLEHSLASPQAMDVQATIA